MNAIENGMEELEEKAALEAAASGSEKKEKITPEDINEILSYKVPLSKEYDLMGEKIKEVDLSGLKNLTTRDGVYIEQVMEKLNYTPRGQKFKDLVYTKHIAMKVTNLPTEFFDSLSWKDMNAVSSRIAVYFLY